jgi:N-acetylmuramoyl-L-alanine amidase
VSQLQQALISLGQLTGPSNGAFGSATEAALRQFQEDMGLVADGIYGPSTHEALLKALSRARPPVPLKPTVVSCASPHHGPRGGASIDAIILHPTSTRDPRRESLPRRTSAGAGAESAHYLVAPDGTLYQRVSDHEQAFHAGLSALHGQVRPSVNARSIGIEITHGGSGHSPFTEAQYRTLTKLVTYLVRRYSIPPENVLSQRSVALVRGKSLPTDDFDWARLRRAMTTEA